MFIPTASPSFDFYGADRPGQNLFGNCLLALDANTGSRLWHFQTTHHDLWDRDNGSPPNLLTVNHNGRDIDAVGIVTKMAYLYLFNRETGEPLFPIEEVPVDTVSTMPGEKPWPTQPIPTKPAPLPDKDLNLNILAKLRLPLHNTSKMKFKNMATNRNLRTTQSVRIVIIACGTWRRQLGRRLTQSAHQCLIRQLQ
ncbi:MAG: PQQ-binding-like beta-propeller repeat protein [Saprospiraceae bacterium]|nr:PQQ-binding-like beta-propeller repeat protein [Saprospiraceae bacterium]